MEAKYKELLGSLGRGVSILMNFSSRNVKRSECECSGMTILELLLAIAMLVIFTGVVVIVMHFTLRFFKPSGASSGNGLLIDHGQLHIAMDHLVDVLSQPGVSVGSISFYKKDPSALSKACVNDPVSQWALSNFLDKDKIKNLLPPDYRLCLLKTDEIASETAFTPSIYLLLALPKQVTESSLPTRRLFCRPRPYC